MNRGEIGIGILIGAFVTIGIALSTFWGNAINKVDGKAQSALDRTAELLSIVKVTQNDVAWLRKIIETNQTLKPALASSSKIAL